MASISSDVYVRNGSLTFHESKLHVINLNLLPNSVLKNPFFNFHSMFQQLIPLFDPHKCQFNMTIFQVTVCVINLR